MVYEHFLEQFTNWRPTQLYWQRFSIAEAYGKEEVRNVYKEIFAEAKTDFKLLTELVMILNHKTWQHCEELANSGLCETYTKLFYDTQKYALSTLKGDELKYFADVTD